MNTDIKMHTVSSDVLAAVGYDAETKTLRVQFKSGKVYDYSNVPSEIFAGLMGATSHGKYYSANVRGKFTSQLLG